MNAAGRKPAAFRIGELCGTASGRAALLLCNEGAAVQKDDETPNGAPKRVSPAAAREVEQTALLAEKLAKVAPDEDPALVAGAIAIFATETIKRSANTLGEARAYL